MSCLWVIQDIIDPGLVQWGASKEEAKVILGGDQPWTRRVIRVSTCPQVGSMFNEGIWNAQKKTWEGSAIPRTMEGDEAHYTAFLLGTPSLQAAGCSMQRILKMPHAWLVFCIFMGRLLGEFVDREARLVTPVLRQDVQVLVSERRAGWSVYGSASPDGEETGNFFRHGRIWLGGSALGQAWPSTRPSRTCGTCCRPSIVHTRALTDGLAPLWPVISGGTVLSVQHHVIY